MQELYSDEDVFDLLNNLNSQFRDSNVGFRESACLHSQQDQEFTIDLPPSYEEASQAAKNDRQALEEDQARSGTMEPEETVVPESAGLTVLEQFWSDYDSRSGTQNETGDRLVCPLGVRTTPVISEIIEPASSLPQQ